MKKNITVGLIKTSVDMPAVNSYIFDDTEELENIFAINDGIAGFLIKNCDVNICEGNGINQLCGTKVNVLSAEYGLTVYIPDEFTIAVAALIRGCALNGVKLTLMHYNPDAGCFVKQIIF